MRRRWESPRHNGARRRNEVRIEDHRPEKAALVRTGLGTLAQAGLKTWIENAALLIAARVVLRLTDIVDRVVRHRNETVAGLKHHAAVIETVVPLIVDQVAPQLMDLAARWDAGR